MKKCLIIGAGPAGLSLAYFLAREDYEVTVIEKSPTNVGGLAKTVERNGYKFDIGGHRFYTKHKEVEDFWRSLLPEDRFVKRKRLSRIFFRGKYFKYPIEIRECFFKLPLTENFQIFFSYLRNNLLRSKKDIRSFEDWVEINLGKKLYELFFKSYTEKVWGIPCSKISKDWADQRIQGLSLFSILKNSIGSIFAHTDIPKTLISEFLYPQSGPGELWVACRDKVEAFEKCKVLMGAEFKHLRRGVQKPWKVEYQHDSKSNNEEFDFVISTMPLGKFLLSSSETPEEVRTVANKFSHRDFLTVALMLKSRSEIKDNWIYVHEDKVKVARVQFYHNWSEAMVPSKDCSCIGMEYFCSNGDELWSKSDEELLSLAKSEAQSLDLIGEKEVVADYKVIKAPCAYPIYHENYKEDLKLVEDYFKSNEGLFTIGRNGLHRYNNQDHSILSSLACFELITNKKEARDPWHILDHETYLENKENA